MFNEIIFSSNILLNFWCQFDLIRYILVLSPLILCEHCCLPFCHNAVKTRTKKQTKFVCLFVCLSRGLLENHLMDFHNSFFV